MPLAFCKRLIKQGLRLEQTVFVHCIEINRLLALCTYVQLSCWMIPAEINIGDTLSWQFTECLRTPAYYLFGWQHKVNTQEQMSKLKTWLQESGDKPTEDNDLMTPKEKNKPTVH